MKELSHISLFAGIAGIDLAAEWAGFTTVCFVEIDPYCQKVLRKHWPDVEIIGDIRDVTRERIEEVMAYAEQQRLLQCTGGGNQERTRHRKGLSEGRGETVANPSRKGLEREVSKPQLSEPKQFTRCDRGDRRRGAEPIPPITLITGGFPCQPVSHAGKRKGKEDDRWLWPEMLRVISEVRPTWVVAENVAGLLNIGFNDCVSDLEGKGYETISFLIPACAVNAPHRRDRVFIVGYSTRKGLEREITKPQLSGAEQSTRRCSRETDVADTKITKRRLSIGKETPYPRLGKFSQAVENTQLNGLEEQGDRRISERKADTITDSSWWAVEPELGRVAHGIPNRVDRLKCLGNAVVPQQIYPILKGIADIERKKE